MLAKPKHWWRQFWIYFSKCRETGKLDKEGRKLVAVWDLFKYGSTIDKTFAIIGMIAAILVGTGLVIPYFVNFTIASVLIEHGKPYDTELYPQTMPWIIGNVAIAIVMFGAAFVQKYCLNRASANITFKLRIKFIDSLLKQDASYLDRQEFGAVNQQLSESIDIISDGIGEKISLIITNISAIVTCVICGIFISWKGTLINFIVCPIVLIFTIFMMKRIGISTKKEEPYAEKAAGVMQESIMNVKTVQSCNGQAQMIAKFKQFLTKRRIYAVWNYFLNGFLEAFVFLALYIFYVITFYYNAMAYYNGDIKEPGKVFIVPNIMFSAVYFLAKNSAAVVAVTKARVAASMIYEKIETITDSVKSTQLDNLKITDGSIVFSNVKFSYQNNSAKILKGLSFTAEPGETVALVGRSGCGKSTTISLLLRLYELESGSISIDGVDIEKANPGSIRRAVGLVRQEPVLFGGTIADNIRLGDIEITDEQIEHACKTSNAHGFIMRLSNGYETQIGPGSIQLSGGQKQRIAIARAIVKNPKILLLDEATSALDVHSEMSVQQALKAASRGRTTIVIAHRMSTLCDASKILVINDGKVVESGTHDELQQSGGLYSDFVKAQELKDSEFDTVGLNDQNAPPQVPSKVTPVLPDISDKIDASFEEQNKTQNGMSLLLKNMIGYRIPFAITICLSMLRGLEMPLYAYSVIIVFHSMGNLSNWADYHHAILTYCSAMIAIGIYMFIMVLVAITLHGWVAENVVDTIKVRFLASTLNKDGAFLDRAETSNAKLVSLMNSEAPEIKSALDNRLFTFISYTFAIFVLLIEATVFCWQMALAGSGWCIFVFSLLFICMRFSHRHTNQGISKTSHANVAVEIIENVKTIQLLNREKYFITKFAKAIDDVKHDFIRATIYQSIVFAIGIGGVFLADVISYSVGVPLIYHGKVNSDSVFIAAMAMNVTCWNVLFAGITCLEVLRAEPAAAAILPLLDENVQNDGTVFEAKPTGILPNIEGSVCGEGIKFAYPTRPTIKVANGLSFKAPQGQMIALVGPSGGGKSTVLALLERFYQFQSGSLTIDGIPVNNINLHHLRSHIALVGQEPILFAGTIKDNMLLGIDNSSSIDVKKACQLANAADFIEKLPLGYETEVGEKGAFLSGGQKQRIAIARAIVRNPKILLLDEATSALDSESEKAVQHALNSAAKSRTVISIAHRLSLIQNADCIYFIENGSVVESGTHSQLVASGGRYASLARKQRLQK